MGGIVAASQIPVFADDPAVFPKRGQYERLALAYLHVDVGATKPFSILHISDTHLTDAYPHEDEKKLKLKEIRTTTFGGRQEEALRDSLDWAKKNVDYVLHTGDVIDWISEANLDLVKKYWGKNVFGAVGNHEFSRYMWMEKGEGTTSYKALSDELLRKYYPFDINFSSTVLNGVNFVTLDDAYGNVTPEQVDRFRAEVKKGLPIVLCMHIPFYTDVMWRAHEKYWTGAGKKFTSSAIPRIAGDYWTQRNDSTTRDFIAYLKREPMLKAIFAGHIHMTMQDRFSPTAMQYTVGGNFMFCGQEILFT